MCSSGSHSAAFTRKMEALVRSFTAVGKPPPPAPTTPWLSMRSMVMIEND